MIRSCPIRYLNFIYFPPSAILYLNEGIDKLLIDSDTEAADGVEGDDMAPALMPDSDEYDLDTSEDDDDEGTEYIWDKNIRKYERSTFS
ncbi:hypothetical protein Q1695_004690 [Nippostrongylus brasiliensis]|nr:hypothetical protein Q1695_004690 [Nippostrongylus brasiliensis]